MNKYEKLRRILLIETTIKMLELSSKHTGVKLSVVDEWKEVLSELKHDVQQKGDEQ